LSKPASRPLPSQSATSYTITEERLAHGDTAENLFADTFPFVMICRLLDRPSSSDIVWPGGDMQPAGPPLPTSPARRLLPSATESTTWVESKTKKKSLLRGQIGQAGQPHRLEEQRRRETAPRTRARWNAHMPREPCLCSPRARTSQQSDRLDCPSPEIRPVACLSHIHGLGKPRFFSPNPPCRVLTGVLRLSRLLLASLSPPCLCLPTVTSLRRPGVALADHRRGQAGYGAVRSRPASGRQAHLR
jgi:hypothetical protein